MEIFTFAAACLFGALIAIGGFVIGLKNPPLSIVPSTVIMIYMIFGWPFNAFRVWPFIYAEVAGLIAALAIIVYLVGSNNWNKAETNDYQVKAVRNGCLYPGTHGRQPKTGQIFWVIEQRTRLYKDSSFAPTGHECGNDPCFVCEGLPDVLTPEIHIYDLNGRSYGWQPADNFKRHDG